MKHLPAIIIIAATIAGCKKDKEPCEENNYGSLCFENRTGNPIQIRMDGAVLFTVAPYQTECEEQTPAGSHDIQAIDGSLMWDFSAIAEACSTKNQILLDRCDTVVCLNGGTCLSGVCDCPPGYTGAYCETLIPSNPVGMEIRMITLKKYPNSESGGADPFVRIKDAGGNVVLTTNYYSDVSVNQVLTYTSLSATLQMQGTSTIYVYDYDTFVDDLLGTLYLDAGDHYSQGDDLEIINISTAAIEMDVLVKWKF